MKKLLIVLLCAFSLLIAPTTISAANTTFKEFLPNRLFGRGVENCAEKTVSWTIGVGLRRHKQMFEDRTYASPAGASTDAVFNGGVMTVLIPNNQNIDTASVNFTIPVFVATPFGFMSKIYYEHDISGDFTEVSASGYTSIGDFIASLNDYEYGYYMDFNSITGETNFKLIIKIPSLENQYNLENYLDLFDNLKDDFDLDPVEDATQIEYSIDGNTGYSDGILVNFDTNVSNPDLPISISSQLVEENNKTFYEIGAELCSQIDGTIQIQNFAEYSRPLSNVEFFVDVYDEQIQGFIPYEVNGQIISTITDSNGRATISGLPGGIYRLRQDVPAGHSPDPNLDSYEFVIDQSTTYYNVTVRNFEGILTNLIVNWEIFYEKYGWIPDGYVSIDIGNGDVSEFADFQGNSDEGIWRGNYYDSYGLLSDPRLSIRMEDDSFVYLVQIKTSGNTLELTVLTLCWEPYIEILWIDDGDADGIRPDSLVVTLLQDGQPLVTNAGIEISEIIWYAYYDLVEFNPDSDYTYAIDAVDGYDISIETDRIIMTRVKEPDIPPVPSEDPPDPQETLPVEDDIKPKTPPVLPSAGVERGIGIVLCIGCIFMVLGFKRKGKKHEN